MTLTEFTSVLDTACRENSIPQPTSEISEHLFCLYELLVDQNSKYNLTAITSPEDVIYKHFVDCLLLSAHLPLNISLIDIGCGAGFPSLPLGIARPDLKITSLDSTAKKIHFIELAAQRLGLQNITTLCGRAEEFAHKSDYRDKFDAATARAVASFPVLCELCLPFVRSGGQFVAMKGRYSEEEFNISPSSLGQLSAKDLEVTPYSLIIHQNSEQRTLVKLKKIGKTLDNFPRKFAQISKNPLK